MDSPHTRHRIVGGGAVFERGGAAVGKIAFDAAMFRGMVAFEEEMAFDAAMIRGTVAVEASIGVSVCVRSAIESLSKFSCASIAVERVSERCSFAKSMSMFG